MTDLLDNLGQELDPEIVAISEVKNEPGRNGVPSLTECAKCGRPLPAEGEPGYHPQRKYHPECRVKKPSKVSPDPDAPAPRSVTNNFKVTLPKSSAKVDADISAVEESAAYMLGFVPMILAGLGDDVCPEALASAIPAIAHQLALLSKYHPFIRKIFVSGEGTGEAMAWVGLVIAVSPAIIAILSHHNVLRGKMAERLEEVAGYMDLLGGAARGSSE